MAELGLPGALQPRRPVRRGMAGEGGRPAGRARPLDPAGILWRSAARALGSALRCWPLLAFLFATAVEAQVVSTRIWPAKDYTRLTLESREAIDYTIFSLKDPERLVLDLETVDIPPELAELGGKVAKIIWNPIGTKDYGPTVAAIAQDSDAVVAVVVGADRIRLFEAWFSFGMDKKYKIYGGYWMHQDALPQMDDRAVGMIGNSPATPQPKHMFRGAYFS